MSAGTAGSSRPSAGPEQVGLAQAVAERSGVAACPCREPAAGWAGAAGWVRDRMWAVPAPVLTAAASEQDRRSAAWGPDRTAEAESGPGRTPGAERDSTAGVRAG